MAHSSVNERRRTSQDPEVEEEATHRRRGAISPNPDTYTAHTRDYPESFFVYGGWEDLTGVQNKSYIYSKRIPLHLRQAYKSLAYRLEEYKNGREHKRAIGLLEKEAKDKGYYSLDNYCDNTDYKLWRKEGEVTMSEAMAFGMRYSLGYFYGHEEIKTLDQQKEELIDKEDKAIDNVLLDEVSQFADSFDLTIPSIGLQTIKKTVNLPISSKLFSGIIGLESITGLHRDNVALLLLYRTLSLQSGLCKREHVKQAKEIVDIFFRRLGCRNAMLRIALDWAYGRNVRKGNFQR